MAESEPEHPRIRASPEVTKPTRGRRPACYPGAVAQQGDGAADRRSGGRMAVEQARPTRQSDDEAQPRQTPSARRSRADDRVPDTSGDRGEPAPPRQDLQALQEQIGRAI